MADPPATIALVLDPADPWLPHLAARWPVWVPDAPASQAAAGAYEEPEWHDAGLRRAGVSFVPVAPGGARAAVLRTAGFAHTLVGEVPGRVPAGFIALRRGPAGLPGAA